MHEKRWGPLRQNAYFVTEYLEGTELLGLLPSMNAQQQRQVAAEVVKAFEIMRREKLTHGDMKASNLLWVDGQLFFIDLDAATKHRSLISWRRSHARDLKRFKKNWLEHAELNQLFEQLLQP
jgi:tRNA A-37 threonylcarbamoyl transferase component Bud32